MIAPTAILLLLVTSAEAGPFGPDKPVWDDLRARFGLLGPLDGAFGRWPRLASEARDLGYVSPPEETNIDFDILCPDKDPAVCIIYDKRGNVGGIELTVLRSDISNTSYPVDKHPMFRPITRFGKSVYTTTLFTVSQNYLTKDFGRNSLTANGTGTGLWLQNGPSRENLFEIPRFEKDIGTTLYTKESCIPGMGRHYYYNISPSLPCEEFFPIFGLYRYGELIGFGWQTFGKFTPFGKTKFETVPKIVIKPTIPNAPQCLLDFADKFGVLGLHVYFVHNPWLIHCFWS